MSTYDDASLILYPSGYKEDKLYSLKPTDGSGDLTFTRASTATRVNADGLIETSPVNLLQQSETFENATWTKDGLTVTTNTTVAPNGTTTADTFTEGSASGQHRIYQVSAQSTNIYTISVYVKNITGTRQAYIDLGPVTGFFNFASETTYSASGIASFENVGNGWYRFSLTTATAITPSTIYMGLGQSNSETYTGNGTSAIAFWGAQINSGATAKTYFPTTDRLNVPRIDYTGGGCGKLLLEPQRTNLVTYSEQFDNAAWAKEDISVTANATTSPDGTTNADLLLPNTNNIDHSIYDQTNIATEAFTVFLKAGGYNYAFLGENNNVAADGAFFDLANGVVSQNTSTLAASIEDYGNGWYRCSLVGSFSTNYRIICTSENGTSFIHAGDGIKGVYAYGAQAESGSYPTSLINTSGTAVTRLADSASKTGISSLIGQTEGTLFLELDIVAGSPNYHTLMQIYGDSNNRIAIGQDTNSTNVFMYINGSGTVSYQLVTTPAGHYKIALAYKNEDSVLYINGAAAITTARAISLSTSLNTLFLNNFAGTEIGIYKNYQSILFKTRLTNDQLADLTGGNKTTFNALATFYGYQIL